MEETGRGEEAALNHEAVNHARLPTGKIPLLLPPPPGKVPPCHSANWDFRNAFSKA
jgi:hypothetical protein